MKKYFNFISFTLVLFALLVGTMNLKGSNKPYLVTKEYCTLTMKFFSADTIVVVVPESCTMSEADRHAIENALCCENAQCKPVYMYKSEKVVSESDNKKHLLFYGCFNKFQRKEFLGIPVKKQGGGFRFENRSFTDPADAFFYVNKKANRLYLCKNSEKSQHQFFKIGGTGYPLHIFHESEIVLTGVY